MKFQTYADLCSLLNGLCGISASVLYYHNKGGYEKFFIASGIFDVLDGKIARLETGLKHNYGILFDSICDSVSFGLFPSIIVYKQTNQKKIALLYYLSSILRLSIFTIKTYKKELPSNKFKGIPTPLSTLIILLFSKVSQLKNKYLFNLICSLLIVNMNNSQLEIPKL